MFRICLGFTTAFLNLIEIVLILKKSRRKTPFEIILLSLGFADFIAGAGTLLIGTVHLLNFLLSTAKSTLVEIVLDTIRIFTVVSVSTSIFHVLLIAIERFTAVHFPFHQRILLSKRKISRIIITVIWMISVAVGLLFQLEYTTHMTVVLVTSLLTIVLLIIIYALIARKLILYKTQTKRLSDSRISGCTNKIQRLVVINSAILVACFILCWSPWIIFTIQMIAMKKDKVRHRVLSHYIVVINSLLDPMIYFLVSCYGRRNRV